MSPVDEEHAPQLGQMVEILRTEGDLGDGNYIADNQGFITSLVQAYSFDTGDDRAGRCAAGRLPEQPISAVRAAVAGGGAVHGRAGHTARHRLGHHRDGHAASLAARNIAARPFWRFAVRPATPQAIYPQRYLDAPQPPDGPRQWITDLAIAGETGKGVSVVADCRVPWVPNGQEICDCCGLTLDPDAVAARGGLQAVVDGLAGSAARLSLKTGTYPLAQPLVLTKQHAGLTIEGCNDGVIIAAGDGDPAAFISGLVRLDGAVELTLRNLTFQPPVVPIAGADGVAVMVGVLITSATDLVIEACNFPLSTPTALSIGAAIVVLGPTQGVTVRRSSFSAVGSVVLFGILAWVSGTNAATACNRWEIAENSFESLVAAVLVYAQIGLIRCSGNTVANGCAGFIFADANLGAANAFVNASQQNRTQAQNAIVAPAAAAILRQDMLADVITKGAPIVDALKIAPPSQTVSDEANAVLLNEMRARGASVFATLAGIDTTTPAAAPTPDASAANSASGTVEAASLFAEIYERALTPALRIENNEIALGTATPPWLGIGVIQSPSDQIATSMISGNRVTVPSQTTIACGLLFPTAAVVSGNIFVQLQEGGKETLLPSLVVLSESSLIQVSANVGRWGELVLPARTSPPATASWDFLSTFQ